MKNKKEAIRHSIIDCYFHKHNKWYDNFTYNLKKHGYVVVHKYEIGLYAILAGSGIYYWGKELFLLINR